MSRFYYEFDTSQPLTQKQINWLNDKLVNKLPFEDTEDLTDLPEVISIIAPRASLNA